MNIILTGKRSIGDQIKEKMIQYIQTGVYAPDEKLPSVRELAVELKVNPNTVVKVYAALEAEGYIYSLPKKGYYASGKKSVDKTMAAEQFKKDVSNALKVFTAEELRHILEQAIQEKESNE